MPVSINDFFQQAVQPDLDVQLHLRQDNSVAQGSGLTGIKKFFASAHKAENRAVATEFYQAVERSFAQNPNFKDRTGILDALQKLIHTGKPLTTGTVRQAKLALDFAKNFHVAEGLSQEGKIPLSHKSSFAMFAMAHNLPLDDAAQIGSALKEYCIKELAAKEMVKVPGGVDEKSAAPIQTLLKKACASMVREGSGFAQKLDQTLGDDFTFDDFCRFFEQEKAAFLERVGNVPVSVLKFTAENPRPGEYIALFNEAKALFPNENTAAGLIPFIMDNNQPIATEAERNLCINLYAAEVSATKSAETVMEQNGLPKEFASAVAHNPKVMAEIKRYTSEQTAGAGKIFAQEQVDSIIRKAAEDFTQENLAKLQEFKAMVQNPPLELDPPLTAETMPQYMNMMMTGEKILEPLLTDAPLDKNFLQNLADHVQSMNSAAYSVRGDFGTDDLQRALKNSIQLLLAKQGVSPSGYMELMANIQIKFGTAARELTALTSACQMYTFKEAGIHFLSDGLTMFRALEGHAKVLLSLMDHDQRVMLGVEKPDGTTLSGEKLRAENEKLAVNFLESNFEHACKLNEISQPLREFAKTYGIEIPGADPQAAGLRQSAETERLKDGNRILTDAVVKTYLPEKGMLVESKTDIFRDLFAKLSAKEGNNFGEINVDTLDISRFTRSVNEEIFLTANAAVKEGKIADSAAVHAAVERGIEKELKVLQEMFGQIDALPEESFTAEEKAKIKETVSSCNIRNFQVVKDLAELGKKSSFCENLVDLASPDADGRLISQAVVSMAEAYHALLYKPGSEIRSESEALPFLLSFGVKMSGISQAEAGEMHKNLSSSYAVGVADTFLYVLDEYKKNIKEKLSDSTLSDQQKAALREPAAKQATLLFSVPGMMNYLRDAATVASGQNVPREAMLFYKSDIRQLTDVPVSLKTGVTPQFNKRVFKDILPNRYLLFAKKQPLTPEEYQALDALATSLNAGLKENRLNSLVYSTGGWETIIGDAAPELAAALRKNGFKPLSPKELWDVLMGTPMPPQVTKDNFSQVFYDTIIKNYRQTVLSTLSPQQAKGTEAMLHLGYLIGSGISVKKLFELLQPGGRLTLEDIPSDMAELGSMAHVTADTAYRLTVDFHRQNSDSEWSFINAKGEKFSINPHKIPPEQNKPDNPEYQQILEKARNMTHSDGQMRRVMQAFSQESIKLAQPFSMLFSGLKLNEHGSYTMTAEEQPDGSVIMDIKSPDGLPLCMHEQFRINTDGTHKCLKFDIFRNTALTH